jgi:hypothetical protein
MEIMLASLYSAATPLPRSRETVMMRPPGSSVSPGLTWVN